MKEYAIKTEQLKKHFSEKRLKRYSVDVFISLCNKLEETEYENDEIKVLIEKTYYNLVELSKLVKPKTKEYFQAFRKLQKIVRDEFGYTAKDQLQSEFTGLGIAFGVALGAPMMAINPAFGGIGLPIGLAIGAGLGVKKEKEAQEKGLVY